MQGKEEVEEEILSLQTEIMHSVKLPKKKA